MSETDNEANPVPPPEVQSSVVKEAEVKLKEMSRKAKERQHEATRRKSQTATRKPPQRQDGSNLRLVLIGGLGLGVLGILYLMLRKPAKEEFVFTPYEPPKRSPQKPKEDSVSTRHEEQKKMPEREATGFEINSF